MKIKCIDGITRDFQLPRQEYSYSNSLSDAYCKNCLKNFGIHDTKILKPEFKKHICTVKYNNVRDQIIIGETE